jgi:lysine 2,3-aminomutase
LPEPGLHLEEFPDVQQSAPRRTLHTVDELAAEGLIAPDQVGAIERVADDFAVAVSPEMLDRIRDQGPDGPLARQFVPSARELNILPEESEDPIGDGQYVPVKGITHRYPDRLLLIPIHSCAIYCRFCFRREKVGPGEEYLRPHELEAALDYIRSKPELREVILTGGDPLVMAPRRIKHIMDSLGALPNLDVIRFHTRVPLVAPERITDELIEVLHWNRITCIVLHVNHASEFGDAGRAALKKLRMNGFMMMAHSVLLKGVNDNVDAMTDLLRECVRNGVKPYYLHHCDLAEGTSHFRTNFDEGQALMRALRGRVSGLAQTNYVLHIPDGHGKVPIGPSYLSRDDQNYTVTDYKGEKHQYPLPPEAAGSEEGGAAYPPS